MAPARAAALAACCEGPARAVVRGTRGLAHRWENASIFPLQRGPKGTAHDLTVQLPVQVGTHGTSWTRWLCGGELETRSRVGRRRHNHVTVWPRCWSHGDGLRTASRWRYKRGLFRHWVLVTDSSVLKRVPARLSIESSDRRSQPKETAENLMGRLGCMGAG